jgi:hypothetical protein
MDGDGVSPTFHALGQIAWAAKEACYETPQSTWLVLRYVSDAMIAFNIAFPEGLALLSPQLPSGDQIRLGMERAGDIFREVHRG